MEHNENSIGEKSSKIVTVSNPPFPTNRYNIIMADPPWSYDDTCDAGERGAAHKYDVMSDTDIASIPVHNLAAPDCALFMWATFPKLREAFMVMDAWGFTYKTNAFTWVKLSPNGRPFWGMGRWTRSNAEICLLGVRGKPARVNAGVHSIVQTVIGEHSQKPNEVRQAIVQLMGDLPRIELFARRRYWGWDAWGNQVNDYYEDDPAEQLF